MLAHWLSPTLALDHVIVHGRNSPPGWDAAPRSGTVGAEGSVHWPKLHTYSMILLLPTKGESDANPLSGARRLAAHFTARSSAAIVSSRSADSGSYYELRCSAAEDQGR